MPIGPRPRVVDEASLAMLAAWLLTLVRLLAKLLAKLLTALNRLVVLLTLSRRADGTIAPAPEPAAVAAVAAVDG